NQVYNNIIVGTHQAAGGGLGYGILLGGFANTTPMAGTQVYNNIIQVPTGASTISFQNGIITPSQVYANIYYGASVTLSEWQALRDQGNTFAIDPGFTDAVKQNYSVLPG